jgi:hypothetical protein
MLRLEICRRCDTRLFNFYSRISLDPRPLQELVVEALREFPAIPGPSEVNLVQSHKRRVQLCQKLQKHYAPSDALLIPKPKVVLALRNEPQDMLVWPGCPLIAASRKYRHNWTFLVKTVSPENIELYPHNEPDSLVQMPPDEVVKHFRISWARTIHSAQGLQWGRVRVHDVFSPFFTKAHLVVALSRCENSDCLDFGSYTCPRNEPEEA